MLRTVRLGTFETNSSSMHTLTLGKKAVNYKGQLGEPESIQKIPFGEFGWGVDDLRDSESILSYLLTSFQYMERMAEHAEDLDELPRYQWLVDAIKDYSGVTIKAVPDNSGYNPKGYIDHQSQDTLEEYFKMPEKKFKSAVIDLIFGGSVLHIDNDNH